MNLLCCIVTNKMSKSYIVMVAALLVVVVYVSQTLIEVATKSELDPTYSHIPVVNLIDNIFPKQIVTSFTTKGNSQFCSEAQDHSKSRVREYCKTKTNEWTKVFRFVISNWKIIIYFLAL